MGGQYDRNGGSVSPEYPEIKNEVIEAAESFKKDANALIKVLKAHLKIEEFPGVEQYLFFTNISKEEPDTFKSIEFERISQVWENIQNNSQMSDEWNYMFHGLECRFRNNISGQIVDVFLLFENEYGVLDPYFFSNYILTTPNKFKHLKILIEDPYKDGCLIIGFLHEIGRLRMVESAGGVKRKGHTI